VISPFKKIRQFFNSKKALNIATLDEFQEVLYESDMGIGTIEKIIAPLKEKIVEHKQLTSQHIEQAFSEIFLPKLSSLEKTFVLKNNPAIIMMVGVNGVGKTTTIAKIARRYQIAKKKTLLVAADTFRAAAVEQLRTWGERLDIEVFFKTRKDRSVVSHF